MNIRRACMMDWTQTLPIRLNDKSWRKAYCIWSREYLELSSTRTLSRETLLGECDSRWLKFRLILPLISSSLSEWLKHAGVNNNRYFKGTFIKRVITRTTSQDNVIILFVRWRISTIWLIAEYMAVYISSSVSINSSKQWGRLTFQIMFWSHVWSHRHEI